MSTDWSKVSSSMPGTGGGRGRGPGGQGSGQGRGKGKSDSYFGGGQQKIKEQRRELVEAIERKNMGLVERLLKRGAGATHTNANTGETLLHRAASLGDNRIIEILLRHGADRSAKDNKGKTPADVAKHPGTKTLLEGWEQNQMQMKQFLEKGAAGGQKKGYGGEQQRANWGDRKQELGNNESKEWNETTGYEDFKFVRTLPANRDKEDPYKKDSHGKRMQDEAGDELFERRFVEKPHEEYGWGPDQEKTPDMFYPEGNQGPGSEQNAWPDMTDLTTLESFSHSARNATYKAALNLGLHWGKEKKWWNPAMAPYLKGVVNGRHVFDLTITIAQIRKMVRLMQSLVMDRCKILFVCNGRNEDMNALVKIMAMRCNMPFLEVPWVNGALYDWDKLAPEYRGRGHGKANSKCKKMGKYGVEHKRSLLFRRLESPPDFVFFVSTKFNRTMIDECNAHRIPMAALCDSDVKTMHLQYVVPCNTESVPAVHFVLDMITRGILEAQHLMESRQGQNKSGENPWELRTVEKEKRQEEAEKLSKWLRSTNNDIYKVNPGNQKSPYDSDGFDLEEEQFYESETPASDNSPNVQLRRMNLSAYPSFSWFKAGRGSGNWAWRGQPYFNPKDRDDNKAEDSAFTRPDQIPPNDVFKRRLRQQIDDEKMAAPIKPEAWPKTGANWHDFNFHAMEQHAFREMSRPVAGKREGREGDSDDEAEATISRRKYKEQLENKILSKYWDVNEITRELPDIEKSPPSETASKKATS